MQVDLSMSEYVVFSSGGALLPTGGLLLLMLFCLRGTCELEKTASFKRAGEGSRPVFG